MTQSILLKSKYSLARKQEESKLNPLVRSKLSQLSDLSFQKRVNYGDDQKIYLNDLKGYYYGQLVNRIPNGFGSV